IHSRQSRNFPIQLNRHYYPVQQESSANCRLLHSNALNTIHFPLSPKPIHGRCFMAMQESKSQAVSRMATAARFSLRATIFRSEAPNLGSLCEPSIEDAL